jgi:DNA-binding transcriptional ArsR family regulator
MYRVKRYRDITDPSLAKALAHPLRTRILAALEDRTASPSELASELGAPLGVVSYHVRRLAGLRFLKLVKRVPRRGAVEHYYTAVAGPHITSSAWGSTPALAKQAMISSVLTDVGRRAADAATTGGFDDSLSHISRTPVTLDREGWKEAARELDALLARIREIEAESAQRLARADHAGERRAEAVLMLFRAPGSAAHTAAAGEDGAAERIAARHVDGARASSSAG